MFIDSPLNATPETPAMNRPSPVQETKLGHCDWCKSERIVNVATSAPYALVGANMLGYAFTDTCCISSARYIVSFLDV